MIPRCLTLFLFFLFMILQPICVMAVPRVTEMTVEEKVGQILMVFFKGEEVNEEARTLIEKAHVGSIIYYKWANGLHNPEQVLNLSQSLQKLASEQPHAIPLLIATDQEGGPVSRLNFTKYPSNQELAKNNQPELATLCASTIGYELESIGINMNLAPVVDVNSDPNKPGMGVRSFGSSPERVAEFGKCALDGYDHAHIIATLKHFPGYGEATVDPHLELAVVNKSREELEKVELFPFKKLAPFAKAIMTAHVLMPALDPTHCATLSSKIVEGILRKEWRYEGIVLTDSLVMQGILNSCESVEEAAVQAFLAGHDILLFGGKLLQQKDNRDLTAADILRIHQYLVQAMRSGRISEARLNQSVERILSLKKGIERV